MVGGGPAGVGGVSGGAGAGVPAGDRGLEVSEAGGSPDHRTAPGGFTWTGPAGQPLGISWTMGYATRPEAEAVGRGYLTQHGGSYQLVMSGGL